MNVVVTGSAGFIGSNLVDSLLARGHNVLGIDNLSTGKLEFIEHNTSNKNYKFIKFDLYKDKNLYELIINCEIVFHLAANADVRFGINNTKKDLEQNTIVTYNVLEAMRLANVNKIVFSSTGSIYGETRIVPTPENVEFPIQTSFYGASKLAGEALIQSYCEAFDFKSWIFRFVSILGPRYSHGHVFDFIQKLNKDKTKLEVLGNGKQKKSYLHVSDCINGIFHGLDNFQEKVNILNLGFDGICQVSDSISWITETLKVNPILMYGTEERGWIGDVPLIHLDITKIRDSGWTPKLTIEESVKDTVHYLKNNIWLFSDGR